MLQLMELASFLIYQVAEVDPFVGGSIQMMLNMGGKAFTPIENLELENVRLRSETLRLVWRLLSTQDIEFKSRFKTKLENGELSKLI